MQQFLLPFLADATAMILNTDNCHTIHFLHLHQYFGILLAELDGIAQQVADHRLQHVNISVNHHSLRFHLADSYLFQTCHHTKNLNDTVCHFDEIHILINHIQLTDLTLCPFQQVIQQ